MTLQQAAEKCRRWVILKHDSDMVQQYLQQHPQWKYVSVKLNSHPVFLQIDTALDMTLI